MNTPLFPDLIVNGELVPHAIVAAETQNHEAPKNKPGIAWRKAVNAVAIRTLLLQAARARGLEPVNAEVGPGRFETDEEALIRNLLDLDVDAATPSAEAVEAEWQKDPSRFRTPPLWEVSHILFACDPREEVAKGKALERATAVSGLIADNPKSFATLAARESDCGSKASAGALGQLGPGDTVPEFETILRGLPEGTITREPVLTRHGYHIIRLDALAIGQILPFEAVRVKIAEALEKTAWARAAKIYVNQLVSAAEISGANLSAV